MFSHAAGHRAVLLLSLLLVAISLSAGLGIAPSVSPSGWGELATLPASASMTPARQLNTCPNSYFYGSSTQLTLQNTVDCAGAAGFTGNLEITFVSMSYQESNFCPGAIEGGSGTCFSTGPGCGSGNANAEGILQQGTAGQCPPTGGPFSVPGYSPSSCSTWSGSSSDWGGIYFNPLCSFQWALAYYSQNGGGDYSFWGSYLSGAYCNWAPNGFLGTGSVTCSGTGQNQANLPWSTVCPNNVCPSSGALAATYSVQDLTTGSALACGGTLTTGDSIQFAGNATGGTPPYAYAWTFGDGSSGTGVSVTHTYTATGTVSPVLKVTDSTGATANTGSTCTFTVVAPPTPTISSFTISPASIPLGGSTYANVSVQGGTAPYTMAYTGLPTGCASANVSTLVCTPTATGTFSVTVTVTDHRAQTASSSASVTVTPVSVPGPTIVSFAASPASVPAGSVSYLNATVTGGTTPYSFLYTGLPGGCASANTSSLACKPSATGSFSVALRVTDALGAFVSRSVSLQVTPAVQGPLTITQFTASPSSIPAGGTTVLSVVAQGGAPPYSYTYSGLPTICAPLDVANLTCSGGAAGQYQVKATVTDANGVTASATAALTITSGLGAPQISLFRATPTPVAVGGTTTLSVSVSGGVSPYTYAYTALPTGCATLDSATLTCTPTAAGSFTAVVTVTDHAGSTTSATTAVSVVTPSSSPKLTSFTATPVPGVVGQTLTFSIAVTGGTAPYVASYAGLPSGCANGSGASFSCVPTTAGSYSVSVKVVDALGQSATANLALVVQGASNGGSSSGSSGTSFTRGLTSPSGLVLVGLIVLVALVALLLVLRRRRRVPEPAEADTVSYEPVPMQPWDGTYRPGP